MLAREQASMRRPAVVSERFSSVTVYSGLPGGAGVSERALVRT